jgi:hypothetical protein
MRSSNSERKRARTEATEVTEEEAKRGWRQHGEAVLSRPPTLVPGSAWNWDETTGAMGLLPEQDPLRLSLPGSTNGLLSMLQVQDDSPHGSN